MDKLPNVLWHAGSVHWMANQGPDPPHTIEGINFFLKGKSFHGWGVDRTFLGLFEFGPLHRLQIYHQQIQRLNALLLLGTLTATLYCLWRKRDSLRPLEIAVITTLFPIALETFGPERYGYTDVLIALPLILVIAARVKERPSRWFSSVGLLAGYALLSRVPVPSLALLSVTRYWLALTILLTYVAMTPKEESLPLEKPLPTALPDPIVP